VDSNPAIVSLGARSKACVSIRGLKLSARENKTALNIVIFSFLFFLAEKFCTIHALNENDHEDNKTLL
jgi:hypothetical protein